jgi:hypothetical protein
MAFLYDFVTGGAVAVDKSLEQLKINRYDNTLEISFGTPPIFRGQITP